MAAEVSNGPLPGILRLSPEIRHRLYLLVGLGPWQWAGLCEPNVYNLGQQFESGPAKMRSGNKTARFFGLLVSCRTIYAEASALLYSSNSFFFSYRPAQSLAPLRALNPQTIASLTSLKIILNQTSCHDRGSGTWEGCCEFKMPYLEGVGSKTAAELRKLRCENIHKDSHDPPITASDPSTRDLLIQWQDVSAHLAAHVTPGQLELSLVCDIHPGEVDVAKQVVDGLGLFPRFKDCHLRLSRTPDAQLRKLAKHVVHQNRGLLGSEPAFSSRLSPVSPQIATLPRELRLRILEYTDLITPLKEVLWTRAHGKYLASLPSCPSWEGRGEHEYEPEVHHGCQFSACSFAPWPKRTVGCFCARSHSAFSPNCRCWAPPTPLFLICRTLHEDANFVFFSENRFVVMDGRSVWVFGPPRPSLYEHHRLAASQFFRGAVPIRCLRYLRFVELVFPPYTGGGWPQAGHPVLKDWAETVAWVKDKINAPALTLRMLAKYHEDEDDYSSGSDLTGPQAKETLDSYMLILKPLASLGGPDGLARFYADLTWPWRRTQMGRERRNEQLEETEMWMEDKERWLKGRAERMVLGERYDRQCARDDEPGEGGWCFLFTRDC
jgi:hypothetical protein